MYLTILALPLLGGLISGLLGRKCGVKGSEIISTLCILGALILSVLAFYEVGLNGSGVTVKTLGWLESGNLNIEWGLKFDSLTVSMLIPVLGISSMVHMYSIGYMSNDPHPQRFFSYLSIFTFLMLILVTADNYLLMFVGWEGVGISSYLLINFWFTRIQANKAAIKALVVNRVGDWGLSIGLFGLLWVFGNIDYSTIMSISNQIDKGLISIITIFLLIGVIGKSAQIGLHTWLIDAMEGPTPVSALIHAATMVTAGVYLILRSSPLFEESEMLILVSAVGGLTAFFASTAALVQNDLKRVIAYSTASQLGYMVLGCGLSNYSISLFHLFNHAFFKALLFLSAGSVIHAMNDEQDMRKMGGLIRLLPFTYAAMVVGSLSLIAFPFLTGFYSKDAILESAYGQYLLQGSLAYWIGVISATFTSFYSFRLLYLTFIATPNGPKKNYLLVHDAPLIMGIPLILLSMGGIFLGYLGKDLFIGLGTPFWGNALYVSPDHLTIIDGEAAPTIMKLLPLILSILGGLSALIPYQNSRLSSVLISKGGTKLLRKIYIFLSKRYWFDSIYNYYITNRALHIGYITNKIIDRGLIEILGPHGLIIFFRGLSSRLAILDTGFIPHYALYIFIGLISFILLILISQ